jgi:hypothetical protein
MKLLREIENEYEIIRYYDEQITVFDRETLEKLHEIPMFS